MVGKMSLLRWQWLLRIPEGNAPTRKLAALFLYCGSMSTFIAPDRKVKRISKNISLLVMTTLPFTVTTASAERTFSMLRHDAVTPSQDKVEI